MGDAGLPMRRHRGETGAAKRSGFACGYAPAMEASTVRVARVTPELADAVRALRVAPAQAAYVGDPAFNLANALQDRLSEAMAVLRGDDVIGFYRLDFSPRAITGRPHPAPSVGVRAFLVDHRHQGHGIGAVAARAMCDDLAHRHPRQRLALLAVHCRNRAAVATYRRAGFIDTGQWLGGGRAGPQHVMLRRLAPVAAPARMGQSPDG
jgi:RimJ/RimL family protein N-acetyltransferase